MNRPRLLHLCLGGAIGLLLAGCFGGKPHVVKAESQQRAETALIRGVRAEQKGNHAAAGKFLTEALVVSSSIEDFPAQITALINLARLHRLQHDLASAERYISQALALVTATSDQFAEAAHEKALVDLSYGNPAKALEWAQQALASGQDTTLRGSRRNLVARIQLLLGDRSAAAALARSALLENRSAGQAEEEANSLRIMGMVARTEKRYSEGEAFLREALAIDKRIGKSGKIAIDLEELATTAQQAGNAAAAAGYLKRAFEVNSAAGRLHKAAQNQESLAVIYTRLGDQSKAADARETARKLAAQYESQQQQKSSLTINPSSRP